MAVRAFSVKFWSLKSPVNVKSPKKEVISPTNFGCAPRNTRNYNLRREKADSDYNYKRCETVVGSHISTIIAVDRFEIEDTWS